MPLEIEDLGLIPYEEAHARQLAVLAERVRGEREDTLLLLEHPAVITLGRGTAEGALLEPSRFPVVSTERGGEATLHGPGQLVGYLMRLLPERERDLHAHMRLLEEIVIRTLEEFEVRGVRRQGLTGVWVEERKIASVGVACRRWCTWHGFALNVSIPLTWFSAIRPCGLEAAVMTSMKTETDAGIDMTTVKAIIRRAALALMS